MARLTIWDPLSDLYLSDVLANWLLGQTQLLRNSIDRLSPDDSINEDDEKYTVRVALPGVNLNDLAISVAGQVLTIQGTLQEPEAPEGVHYYLRERPTGRFSRMFRLPREVNVDAAQARYEHGILTVELPKAEIARPRRISVQAQTPLIEGQARPALEERSTTG